MRSLVTPRENIKPERAPFFVLTSQIRLIMVLGTSTLILVVGFGTAIAQSPLFEISLEVESSKLTVGDPIALEILVIHKDGSNVLFPSLPGKWGEFELIRQYPPSSRRNDDGTTTSSKIVELVLFKPGEYFTPSFEINLAGPDGELHKKISHEALITVSSILEEGDTDIRDIRSQASVAVHYAWQWIIGTSLILISMVVGIFLLIRNKIQTLIKTGLDTEPRTPHQIAIDEIWRIKDLNLPESGQFKEHSTLITECIRIYLSNGFGIPAMDLTTSEIRNALKTSEFIDPHATKAMTILQECDLVKFTSMNPTIQEALKCTSETIQLITDTENLANRNGRQEQC
tara:strand:+ start:12223 stop:13251 length:1029 start_codon:yes stop_codon:yes gene_type:complete